MVQDVLLNYIKSKYPDKSFDMPQITLLETKQYLHKLNVKKSVGRDDISTAYLKLSGDVISQHLMDIINMSLDTNSFPSFWKDAKVTAVYKGRVEDDVWTTFSH